MNLSSALYRGLILPAFLAAFVAAPAAAAPGTSKTYHYTGNVAAVCKIGTSTSYAISISVVTGSPQRKSTISLDGMAGNAQSNNNQQTTVTKTYATICNVSSAQTLTLNAPTKATSGANTIAFTFTVKDQGGTTLGTVSNEPGSASVIIPANTSANYTITASSTNLNTLVIGTYTATVTIQ